MYYRINTNRVRAFQGPEVAEERWTKIFAHYVNIEFCSLILEFLAWYNERCEEPATLQAESVREVATSLRIEGVEVMGDFEKALRLSKLEFESTVNNIGDEASNPRLSLQAAPIDELMRHLRSLPVFSGKSFHFLVDEYENLLPYQQRVLNTLIKHCGGLYSFKVGVREMGLKDRSTINPWEQLSHPADYRLINITSELEPRFQKFAASVCEARLNRIVSAENGPVDVQELLYDMPLEEEAEKLGAHEQTDRTIREIASDPEFEQRFGSWLEGASALEVFVLSL